MVSENRESELRETLGDMVVASHRLTRLAARVTGNTESPATWRTLSVLQAVGSLRLGELAAHSRVSQPTMTKLVSKLAETEWIKRIADTDDARAWQIAVTPKGARALQDWRDELSGALVPMFADLSDSEIETIREAVRIVGSRTDLQFATDRASAPSDADRPVADSAEPPPVVLARLIPSRKRRAASSLVEAALPASEP